MKVVIIGAGLSGLLSGIRLSQAGVPFEIIEKNPDVGGTWFENAYPGCRVDNPNHLYSYSFEPNHDWPYHFSTQPLLWKYFQGVADKYGLRPHIQFKTEVIESIYDERSATWNTRVGRSQMRTGIGAFKAAVGDARDTALAKISLSARAIASVPFAFTLILLASAIVAPGVKSSPSWSVPALTVVAPV